MGVCFPAPAVAGSGMSRAGGGRFTGVSGKGGKRLNTRVNSGWLRGVATGAGKIIALAGLSAAAA